MKKGKTKPSYLKIDSKRNKEGVKAPKFHNLKTHCGRGLNVTRTLTVEGINTGNLRKTYGHSILQIESLKDGGLPSATISVDLERGLSYRQRTSSWES